MNRIARIFTTIILIDFLGLTAYVIYEVGFIGAFDAAFSGLSGALLTVDLLLNLVILNIWMYFDARKRGKSAWPYIAVSAMTGAGGPLLYFAMRDAEPDEAAIHGRIMDAPAS